MIQVCAIAEAFHTTPVDVLQWPNPVFLDSLEYLALRDEQQERYDHYVSAQHDYRY